MNRNEIESDPHSLLEGMIIGGYVTGATEGHHLRPRRVPARRAPPRARHRAGPRTTASSATTSWAAASSFDIELVEGAGAFVCGEETALIASLEGHAGPPAPAAALPGAEGPLRQADQHQQRRDLVQHRAHRHQGPGLVHRDRQRQERRAPRSSRWSARCTTPAWSRCRSARRSRTFIYDIGEGGTERPRHQGRADRRPLRRLHPAGDVRHAGGLRDPRPARLHHGLGRHGGDGRRQLHGGRRPLLHRVHPLGVAAASASPAAWASTRRCGS